MLQSKLQRRLISGFLFALFSMILFFAVLDSPASPAIIAGGIVGLILGALMCRWIFNEWKKETTIRNKDNNDTARYTVAVVCSIAGIAASMLMRTFFPDFVIMFYIVSVGTFAVVVSFWSFFNHPPNHN